jgi:hypothetical protein
MNVGQWNALQGHPNGPATAATGPGTFDAVPLRDTPARRVCNVERDSKPYAKACGAWDATSIRAGLARREDVATGERRNR